jgi:membrane protease YdiL (CAAX protease family)
MWLAHPRERRPVRQPVWWVVPLGLVVGAAVPGLPALVLHGNDLSTVSQNSSAALAEAGGLVGFVGLTLLAGPLAEEFGWRGYLQPRVRREHGILAAAAIIGLVWSVWHLPLFFLHGTGQQAAGLLSVRGVTLLVGLFPFSLVMLFLVERLRGGVLAAVAAHFGFNGADSLVPNQGTVGMLMELAVLVLIAFAVAVVYLRDGKSSAPTRD